MPTKVLLKVTSDVRRDLLAAAASFKSEAVVAWEYVVNSLQYVDRGAPPRVQVTVDQRAKKIEVSDNGRGMDASDLEHYFRMHGENKERLRGRPGRGKFGTGKSAAFGIGKVLRVDTVRNGLRNVVQLTRDMIDQSKGDDIPLDWLVRNQAVDAPNGTTVTIGDIVLQKLNASSIVEYIERHLQAFRTIGPQVAVNDHLCEYRDPVVAEEFTFRPTKEQKAVLGDAELHVRVAQAPLPEADQGVAITSGIGNLVAIEKAGVDRKEFGSYLFGNIDVPALETFKTPLEPYDSSRSLFLNPAHPVAQFLIPYIGARLEEVRLKLVAREKETRKTEQARRLAKQAEKIAEILNKDFESVRERLQEIRAASRSRGPAASAFGDSSGGDSESGEWVKGTKVPGNIESTAKGGAGSGSRNRQAPKVTPAGHPSPDGSTSVDPVGGLGTRRTKPRGGFRVDYRQLGKDEQRSKYDPPALSILINLDHPVVAAALGGGSVEEVPFRRLSYEIAFSEYSLALGYEMIQVDPNMPVDDLLYEVRASLNRISLAAAELYR